MSRANFVQAIEHYRKAEQIANDGGDPIGVAIALNNRGLAERRDRSGTDAEVEERRAHAREHLNQALTIRRKLGDRRGLAETLNNLGVLSFEMRHFSEAWRYYHEALQHELAIDNRHGIGIALANLGEVAEELGQVESGARLVATAEWVLTEIGAPVAKQVSSMLVDMAPRAGWPAEAQDALRAQFRCLTTAEACEWALAEVTALSVQV
jgi:tetratricopeptide (TPR) repeat protein